MSHDTLPVRDLGDAMVVASVNRWGQWTELVGYREPDMCDHGMSGWSSCLAIRCPRCGAPMFMPRWTLVHKTAEQIEEMYQMWQAAGCPPWSGRNGWLLSEERWTMTYPPEFDGCGLPVRNDILAAQLRMAAYVEELTDA